MHVVRVGLPLEFKRFLGYDVVCFVVVLRNLSALFDDVGCEVFFLCACDGFGVE